MLNQWNFGRNQFLENANHKNTWKKYEWNWKKFTFVKPIMDDIKRMTSSCLLEGELK